MVKEGGRNLMVKRPGPFGPEAGLTACAPPRSAPREREFCIDNLLVRNHFIIVMVRWTGLAPWEFEFPFPGSLTSTFLEGTQAISSLAGESPCQLPSLPPPCSPTLKNEAVQTSGLGGVGIMGNSLRLGLDTQLPISLRSLVSRR